MALQMAMTLAGTFPVLGYLFLKKMYGERIRARYYVYLLRMGVLFFLCPFQYYKFRVLLIAWTEIFIIKCTDIEIIEGRIARSFLFLLHRNLTKWKNKDIMRK